MSSFEVKRETSPFYLNLYLLHLNSGVRLWNLLRESSSRFIIANWMSQWPSRSPMVKYVLEVRSTHDRELGLCVLIMLTILDSIVHRQLRRPIMWSIQRESLESSLWQSPITTLAFPSNSETWSFKLQCLWFCNYCYLDEPIQQPNLCVELELSAHN